MPGIPAQTINNNQKRVEQERQPVSLTQTGRGSGLTDSLSQTQVQVPVPSDSELAERVAHGLFPDQKHVGKTVKRILEDWAKNPLTPEKRRLVSDALELPRFFFWFRNHAKKPLGYFLDSVRKGYLSQQLEEVERFNDEHPPKSPPEPAAPPDDEADLSRFSDEASSASSQPDDEEYLSPSPGETPPASPRSYALGQIITYGSDKRKFNVIELRDGELVLIKDVETGTYYRLDELGDLLEVDPFEGLD